MPSPQKVNVAFHREITLLPALVLIGPHLLETCNCRRRQARRIPCRPARPDVIDEPTFADAILDRPCTMPPALRSTVRQCAIRRCPGRTHRGTGRGNDGWDGHKVGEGCQKMTTITAARRAASDTRWELRAALGLHLTLDRNREY